MLNFDAHAFSISSVFGPASYFTDFGKLASNILTILVSLAGALALIFIIISGIKLVTASGDPKKISAATSTLTNSIIGLVVVILAFIIIQVVQAFFGGINIIGGGGPGGPPGGGAATCALGSPSVAAGSNLGFGYDGFPAGQKIFIWDGGVNRFNLGTSLTGSQLVSFTIPSTTPPGNYGGFIENGANPAVACGPITVTSGGVPIPACSLSPASMNAGGNITVNSINGLTGQITMQGAFSAIITPLGTLAVPSTVVTIPTTSSPGLYAVRVGGSVDCGDLQVNSLAFGVTCTMADFDSDGTVTILDLSSQANHSGEKIGDPGYAAKFDLNHDGFINITDSAIAQTFFLQTC